VQYVYYLSGYSTLLLCDISAVSMYGILFLMIPLQRAGYHLVLHMFITFALGTLRCAEPGVDGVAQHQEPCHVEAAHQWWAADK
jgi:hypothetical protein